ncbi:MAG: hypothetical protein ACKVS9_14790 [Phycisphaerae bacterium]
MLTLSCAGGCVHTDSAVRSWHVRADGKATDREVSVGQNKADARTAIGDLIDERNDELWVIRDQFRLMTPGLYPYFDSRNVYVYLLNNRVAAIVVRGEYNVYP